VIRKTLARVVAPQDADAANQIDEQLKLGAKVLYRFSKHAYLQAPLVQHGAVGLVVELMRKGHCEAVVAAGALGPLVDLLREGNVASALKVMGFCMRRWILIKEALAFRQMLMNFEGNKGIDIKMPSLW